MQMLADTIAEEYEKGNYVIAGGDFNMDLLGDSGSIFGVSGEDYSWAQPFPTEIIPDGARLVAPYDPENPVPSCRNADSPWDPETNFQITIDGFIITDNIEVESCEVTDQQFAYSDHQPVQLRFRFK
jgi:endonuclease/exonuclease/phosphatase family metal-dependent hydrolase